MGGRAMDPVAMVSAAVELSLPRTKTSLCRRFTDEPREHAWPTADFLHAHAGHGRQGTGNLDQALGCPYHRGPFLSP